jgi:hypothetical protein
MLTALMAVAAIVVAGALTARQVGMTAPPTTSGKPLSDDEIYTGSILSAHKARNLVDLSKDICPLGSSEIF